MGNFIHIHKFAQEINKEGIDREKNILLIYDTHILDHYTK